MLVNMRNLPFKLRRQGYASVLIPFSKLVKVTVMLTVSKVRT